jgi:hypothetical protein
MITALFEVRAFTTCMITAEPSAAAVITPHPVGDHALRERPDAVHITGFQHFRNY